MNNMELFVKTVTVLIAYTQFLSIINISTGAKKITFVNALDMILSLSIVGWGIYLLAKMQ